MELLDKLDKYEALLAKKDELAELTKQNNLDIEGLRREITDLMADSDMERIGYCGYNYSLTEKVCFNKRGGVDEALFDTLKSDGLGDIIRPVVNPKTLQATLRELTEHNGGELPEQYRPYVSEYRYFDISRRRA